jgi:hypothetical protein
MNLNDLDLSQFPDWIQAISSVFAAIGLIITLNLQRKTLIEQKFITQIEQKKFLDS